MLYAMRSAKPVKHGADKRPDDDDRESYFRIEVFSDVVIGAAAHRTCINPRVIA